MNLPRPYPSARQRASGTDGARSVSRLRRFGHRQPLGLHEMQWRKTLHADGMQRLYVETLLMPIRCNPTVHWRFNPRNAGQVLEVTKGDIHAIAELAGQSGSPCR